MIKIGVTVRNTGSRAGKESVLLFINDDVASVVPDARRLRDFEKISLAPGESRRVVFEIPAERLAFVGRDGEWHLEKGSYTVQCDRLVERLDCTADADLGVNI